MFSSLGISSPFYIVTSHIPFKAEVKCGLIGVPKKLGDHLCALGEHYSHLFSTPHAVL